MMGFGAVNFAFAGSELYLRHVGIIPAWTEKNESQNEKQKGQQGVAQRSHQ
jgi:hypothetical protein